LGATPLIVALVTIDKALQDEIITNSGIKFYLDPSYSPEWHCCVTGRIAALPIKCSNKQDRRVLNNLKIGDEVAFNYRVVADFTWGNDESHFISLYEDNPHFQSYVDGKGRKLDITALPGKVLTTQGKRASIWVGTLTDKFGKLIDGVQGSEHDMERWKSQFSFGKTDKYTFNNLFNLNGKDYWRVDLCDIYAKREKGHIVSVGDKIICKPIDETIPKEVSQFLLRTHEDAKIRLQDRAMVLSGGKEKGFKKDQVISFDPKQVERYEFFSKQYYIINENRVNGRWVK
jgi:hypothetical protein